MGNVLETLYPGLGSENEVLRKAALGSSPPTWHPKTSSESPREGQVARHGNQVTMTLTLTLLQSK